MKLTTPSYDIGAARIIVDRRQVGTILGNYHDWSAYLWPVAGEWKMPNRCEEVRAPKLRDLRMELRRRLDDKGPWWAAPPDPSTKNPYDTEGDPT